MRLGVATCSQACDAVTLEEYSGPARLPAVSSLPALWGWDAFAQCRGGTWLCPAGRALSQGTPGAPRPVHDLPPAFSGGLKSMPEAGALGGPSFQHRSAPWGLGGSRCHLLEKWAEFQETVLWVDESSRDGRRLGNGAGVGGTALHPSATEVCSVTAGLGKLRPGHACDAIAAVEGMMVPSLVGRLPAP